jgi:transposase
LKFLGSGNFEFGKIEEHIDTGRWLRCAAGIDVHKHTAIATIMIPDFKANKLRTLTQKFAIKHSSLEDLNRWFEEYKEYGLEYYGIEATSTYYRPVEYALKSNFKQVLLNPYLLKERRKTDKKDSQTIAYVVLAGIFKPNYVMPEIQQLLKTVNRRIIKEIVKRTSASNAIGTTLTNYNILLANEIQVLSVSGKQILCAIVDGEKDSEKAVDKAKYYQAASREIKRKAIVQSLTALPELPSSVRITIGSLYNTAIFHEKQIELYSKELQGLITQYEVKLEATGQILKAIDAIRWLQTIPGVSIRYAETFVAEMGIDMKRFPTAKHAISYAGFNPEKRVSADKIVSSSSLNGNRFVHSVALQVAQSLLQIAKADNELARWGREYKRQNGNSIAAHNKAVAAVARRIVYISWILLSKCEPYSSSQYHFDAKQQKHEKKISNISKQAQDLRASLSQSELSSTSKAKSLQIINTFSQIIGINTSFQVVPNMKDADLIELNLSNRVINILKKEHVNRISILIYHLLSGTLLNLKGLGPISYNEITNALFEAGYLFKTDTNT